MDHFVETRRECLVFGATRFVAAERRSLSLGGIFRIRAFGLIREFAGRCIGRFARAFVHGLLGLSLLHLDRLAGMILLAVAILIVVGILRPVVALVLAFVAVARGFIRHIE